MMMPLVRIRPDATRCGANEYVANNACVNCPAGTTNAANDDASGAIQAVMLRAVARMSSVAK